jgi:hypothetical protein
LFTEALLSDSLTIATSIAPGNAALQLAAVDSWHKLGFRVLSVNTKPEIDLLLEAFPQVQFIETGRDASAIAGKPYIFFDDLLHALKESKAEVCGIVNSDIHLLAGADFPEFIRHNAADGVLFGARVDVESFDSPAGEMYDEGFDYFFFGRKIISAYPAAEFCLGVPWWDYWAPLLPLLAGMPIKELLTPVAFHIRHDAHWDDRLYENFGKKLVQYFSENSMLLAFENRLSMCRDLHQMELLDLAKRGRFICNLIKQRSSGLFYETTAETDPVGTVTTEHYLSLRKKFLNSVDAALQTEIALASALALVRKRDVQLQESEADRAAGIEVIRQRDAQVRDLARALHDMKMSFSWRWTKFLRWLYEKVSG